MIQEYFSQIELILQDFPNIRSLSVTKKIYNAKQGCIGGSVIFENGYRLDFVEVKDIDVYYSKFGFRRHQNCLQHIISILRFTPG